MAIKKDVYYFSHDANALSDPKILAMRCDYGLEGYGLYWAILEMLRNEATYKLPLNKTTYRAIKMQTGTTVDVENYLQDCINEYTDSESGNGLLNTDNRYFWSESLLRRMQKYESLKEKRSQAANLRWNKEKDKKVQKSTKKCKCIKKVCKCIAKGHGKIYKCITKPQKLYAKLCKLNQIKLNKIKLKEIKSIYLSDQKPKPNEKLDEKMDEIEKEEFDKLIANCEIHIFSPGLAIEIMQILKEMYMNLKIREKVKQLNSKKLLYALKNFAIANTKSQIKIPNAYFKQCILSALQQTELSTQYDTDTVYEIEIGDY